MKKFIPLILSCITLGCCYNIKYQLNPRDLQWLAPYNVGDTIVFRSDNLDKSYFDTLLVTKVIFYNPQDENLFHLEHSIWSEAGNTIKGYGITNFEIIHDARKYQHNSWRIDKLSRETTSYEIYLGNCQMEANLNTLQNKKDYLNDKTLSIVMVKDPEAQSTDMNLATVQWNCDSGLIAYHLRDGRIFKYYEKISK